MPRSGVSTKTECGFARFFTGVKSGVRIDGLLSRCSYKYRNWGYNEL